MMALPAAEQNAKQAHARLAGLADANFSEARHRFRKLPEHWHVPLQGGTDASHL